MTTLTRRKFLKISGGAGAVFWLGISPGLAGTVKALSSGEVSQITPWVMVGADGHITIFNTKPEMGQGTFQSIPALIAEELEVSLDQVTVRQSQGEPELGNRQRAGGSASIRTSYEELRKVGAAAREMFIEAGARRWQVNAAECRAEKAMVLHAGTGRSLSYAELAADAAKIEVPKSPRLKSKSEFRILGKPIKRPDIPSKVNGTAMFGIDATVPGMVYASVERCPVLGGTLKSFDDSEALKVPGVIRVVAVDRAISKYTYTGVAVIADTYWAAFQARRKLAITWDTKGYESFNSDSYEKYLRSLADQPGLTDKLEGSPDNLQIASSNLVEAFYETPMVAHHALEPLNGVAHVRGDQLEVWTSTQVTSTLVGDGPNDLPGVAGFDPANVTVHNMFLGGGFGRRLQIDDIVEAVNLAKQISRPVKVVWSREDTTRGGAYRPMTYSALRGGLSADGKLVLLEHKVISPSYFDSFRDFEPDKVDEIMVEGIGHQAYQIPNLKTSWVKADNHIPLGAWRSVTSSTLAFAHECFLDEMAHRAGIDPLQFRLDMLPRESDARRILEALREKSQWDQPLGTDRARGVAQWEFFAGHSVQVVEITLLQNGRVQIDRVVAVIDLGEVVNPDTVQAQVQGAVVMALGAATQPGITFSGGQVVPGNFGDNPLPRMPDAPRVEVHILAEGGKVKGVGEPGLPPFAPALANAIFAASGKRIRRMPFDLSITG